ncbi:SunI/YnzG family protein [Bacillus atrophaeus]|uniref:SunI/YnzG family protein n=1 Tax=Bacillus atrophaeus TaxID=1452 RepID=UPI003F59ABC1
MFGIKVEKSNENLIINWQLSRIEIPIKEIKDVSLDLTYGGEEKNAIRIGTPYGSTDRVVNKTANNTNILFITDTASIMKKSFLNNH